MSSDLGESFTLLDQEMPASSQGNPVAYVGASPETLSSLGGAVPRVFLASAAAHRSALLDVAHQHHHPVLANPGGNTRQFLIPKRLREGPIGGGTRIRR